jgi:hypothetical protein
MGTHAVVEGSGPRPSPKDEVEATFYRILDSEALRSSPVSRALLVFLWENKGKGLSEYAIAVEGLGRPAGFDPKTDATVRVQIARLRAKLKDFYDAEGQGMTLRLHIPLGSHELKWNYDRPEPRWIAVPRQAGIRYPWLLPALAALCVALAVSTAVLARRAANAPVQKAPEGILASMLTNGKPTVVVIPNSTGFQWDQGRVTVFEPNVPFEDWAKSPTLKQLGQQWGPPALNQIYTVARHAVAGFRLLQYIGERGGTVQVLESADLPVDTVAEGNTILMGSPNTGVHMRAIMEKTNFRLARAASPSLVVNQHPLKGEAAEYEESEQSRERRIVPGIIVWLPTRPEGGHTLVLAGRWTSALASMLMSTEGSRIIEREVRKLGSAEGWEMVVQSEVQADTTVLRSWPVAVHEIPASYWK